MLSTIIVGLIVGGITAFAVHSAVKQSKSSGCGCGCTGCSGCVCRGAEKNTQTK